MTIQFLQHTYFFPMMIHGFGFLSLSASLVLPWALTGLAAGERITESLAKDVRQSFTDQEIPLPSRKLISAISTKTTYYVSSNGNDKNSGLSTSSAFKTLERAADLTDPGDTVLIMNGVYKNTSKVGAVLNIKRSGRANAWITYKAYPGHRPRLQSNGWQGVSISNGVSYIEVNGLEVVGNNSNITLGYARNQQNNKSNPLTNGNCIVIDGKKRLTHHIRILNNKVHDCGGGGIGMMESDYVTVDNNEVFNNAWYSVFACSGIGVVTSRNYDNSRDYKIVVTRNKVHNNQMLIPWYQNKKFQDGNGIIVDSNRRFGYKGRTLIANNISYKNGGSGIHTYESEHVDIVHNTTYLNNQTPVINYGQIMSNHSSDIKVYNNILYSARNRPIGSINQSPNSTFNYNLYNNNGSRLNAVGPNDIMADPQFINASTGDFRLKRKSPAINKGFRWNNLKTDALGNPRVYGPASDTGAYEMQY
ncbi:choice-of-anchor Q domain-containing protein [uncultured Nostoc sp.]|uniref:choice-of-anchor Q domain-containing protein n=1 Tax=uncultured Nostoc sp. TaxID=340711 RepID=UPI00261AC964|nr:choice-of-anchor Q domain-containing protein [uncultured Nostoc sp.]